MQAEEMQAARRGRWAVAVMFLANGFVMGSWAPQIPLLLARHQISETTVGLLILGLGLGAVGAMAASGALVAHLGSRRTLWLFAPLASVALAGVVLSPDLWLLAPAMAFMGAMIGCMDVAMNANAIEVEHRLHRPIMSSSHGFWSLGGFLGGLGGGPLIAGLGAGGHAVLASALTLIGVAMALPALLAETPLTPREQPAPKSVWPKGGAIYVIGLMALFSMIPEGAVLDWSALYLSKDFDAGVEATGLAFAAFSAAMAIMRFAGDTIRSRFGAVRTLRVSGLVAAAGMFGASVAPSGGLVVVCFALAGLGIANMVPIALSAAGNQPGVSAGSGIALVTMMGYCGILIAPSAIGFVGEHLGFRPTFGTLALLLVAVANLSAKVSSADRDIRG